MNERLGIAIPVYNNAMLLKECLQSLDAQTEKSFDVYIFDDSSTEDYLPIVSCFQNLCIKYIRNEKNLGALVNMQHAFASLKHNYAFVMILHEDDLLHYQFVKMFLKVISIKKEISFVLCNFNSFDSTDELDKYNNKSYNSNFSLINKKELSFLFLQLKPLAFGSVIYNTNVYKSMTFDYAQYEEFADRPFLLNGLTDVSQIALINEPLYYYRSHGITDNRWKKLLPQHVFNLLKLYKSILLKTTFISKAVFKKHAMAFIFDSYNNLILTGKKNFFVSYLVRAKREGFFSIKYALLKLSFINKAATRLKKLFN